MVKLHSHDFIAFDKVHSDDSHGSSACGAQISLLEADTHSEFSNKENIRIFVCNLDFY